MTITMPDLTAAMRLAKRLASAGKLLIGVRAALPWPVRHMSLLALPLTLMPGVPDLGIDELIWAAVAVTLWFTRRELLRAVWAEAGQPYVPYK